MIRTETVPNQNNAHILEVDSRDENWMSQARRLGQMADRLIIKHFKPTASSVPFVKSISRENNLFIQSCREHLVLEKIGASH